MNEDRIPFLATPGGKSDQMVRAMIAERAAAQKARIDYLKSKGPDVINLWGSEAGITALILKSGAEIPTGWRRASEIQRKHVAPDDGVFIVPNGKAKDKDTYAALKAELRKIPALPDAHVFSARMDFGFVIRGRCLMLLSYEKISEQVIISVPRYMPADDEVTDTSHKKQYIPPDCTELKMSEYYALREQVDSTAAK